MSTTISPIELAKFAKLTNQWWDLEGPLKTLHDINPARMQFIENYVSLVGQRVLDVGCGGGILAEAMAKSGAIVTGLDAEPNAIATAKLHAKESLLKISYKCSPIEDFEAKPYPIITCMEMLEHVDNPSVVIEHASRLLDNGGYLFLSTINRTAKAYFSLVLAGEYILNLLPRQTHDYQKFIKPSELAELVRMHGLEPVAISGLNYNPFTRLASLKQSVDVNYLLVCRKSFLGL